MKKLFDGDLEIITPCFCAGADQAVAEIRAPSIRGELRWWFRALGGSQQEEQAIFGGIAGEEGTSSAIVVRVSKQRHAKKKVTLPEKLSNKPNDPFYLLYYAFAGKDDEGIRYQDGGYFSPESRFRLQILQRREISSPLFKQALKAFLFMGAIGLRSNRACGAFFDPADVPTFEKFKAWAATLPSDIQVGWQQNGGNPKFCPNWKSVFGAESEILKLIRGDGYSAGKSGNDPTPLGRSQPRQGSGVRLLPIQLKEGVLPAVIYVPKVLEESCADSAFDLNNFEFLQLA